MYRENSITPAATIVIRQHAYGRKHILLDTKNATGLLWASAYELLML